jgi:glutamyl-tRNA synthetase
MPIPRYHMSAVLDHCGERLAKRHESCQLRALREIRISPEAVVGYLAHRAGLLSEAGRVTPYELLQHFDWAKLPRWAVTLPQDIERLLAEL